MKRRCTVCRFGMAEKVGGVGDIFLRSTKKKFPVYKCDSCGSYFLWSEPTVADLKRAYARGYWWDGSENGTGFTLVMERYRQWVAGLMAGEIEKLVGARGRGVIELGSGVATVLFMGKKKFGWKVTGFDNSREAARVAWERYGIKVEVGDLAKKLPNLKQARIVLASHVLEHLVAPERFLERIRKVLPKDGRLIILVPSAGSLGLRLFGLSWRGFDVPRHLRVYSKDGLVAQLRRSGWVIEKWGGFSARDDAPHLAGSLVPNFDPIVAGARGGAKWYKSLFFGFLTVLLLPVAWIFWRLGWGETITVVVRKG